MLEAATRPFGVGLNEAAREWAQENGWRDPCEVIGSAGWRINPPGDSCTCTPPRAAYEAMRRAAWKLVEEGALVWGEHKVEGGRRAVHFRIPLPAHAQG